MTDTEGLVAQATDLLVHYCLDLGDSNAQQWMDTWLELYSAQWLVLALVEALYLGRYKAISVEHILVAWKRRGKPLCHFTHEFERLVCIRFPQKYGRLTPTQLDFSHRAVSRSLTSASPKNSPVFSRKVNPARPAIAVSQLQSADSRLETSVTPNESKTEQTQADPMSQPILQFVPSSLPSDFSSKLKAVTAKAQAAQLEISK
jgi:hypothetical protein